MRNVVVVFVCAMLSLVSGCGVSWEGAVKGTRTLYREYLNPPADIDYSDRGDLSEAKAALARRIYGIDTRIAELERHMENADRRPTSESVSALFARFPWLGGFAAVDDTGRVLGEAPSMPLKQLDYAPLTALPARGGALRGLRGLVQDNPLGPEILVGVPVYRDADLVGLAVAHFEMRSLMPFSEDAENLIVLSPEAVLWSGRFDVEATPLHDVDWKQIVRSSSGGTVSRSGEEFVWVVRFIGAAPIIFASPAEAPAMPEYTPDPDFLPAGDTLFFPPTREENAVLGVMPGILDAPAASEAPSAVIENPVSE